MEDSNKLDAEIKRKYSFVHRLNDSDRIGACNLLIQAKIWENILLTSVTVMALWTIICIHIGKSTAAESSE